MKYWRRLGEFEIGIIENIKIALSSLRAHKLRSVLTMIGIIIGVGSVVTIVSIGRGGEAILKKQISVHD